MRTCNLPVWTRDAKGAQTDYEYHWIGQIAKVTLPADANGVRAQTRYDYANPDGSGSATGLWVMVLARTCRSTPLDSCVGTSDEIVNETALYPASGNYLPQTATARAGDNSLVSTSSVTYDDVRNVATTTDANGGVGKAFYNGDRQVTGTLGPDPDGGGPLRNRAVDYQYRADGSLDHLTYGTANPDGSGFVALQALYQDYDGYGRKVSQTLRDAAGTAFALTQFNYDNEGRPYCTAVRMNPATWSALPGGCDQATPGPGSPGSPDGPDRIGRIQYDGADRVVTAWSGLGTAQENNVQTAYTANGKVAVAYDAKGNATAYSYDGFDRPLRTCYNAATCTGAGDYDELGGYDVNGNAGSRRMRDGNVWAYHYDALDRPTRATPPAGIDWTDKAIAYGWDNAGHMVRATDTVYGHTVTRGYDPLGRMTFEQNPWRRKDFGYDAGGRLTAIAYGDGFSVGYTYYATNEMARIRENGTTLLVGYGYDDLGRRTSMTRGNGTTTAYAYDGASRLSALTQSIGGAITGAAVTFGYSYNPAGQIRSRTSSNDAYAWTGAANVSRNYAADALNRYAAIDGIPNPAYDGRGNLTKAGSVVYSYNASNQLAAANGNWFYHDAVGRLDVDAGGCQFFDYAGSRMTEELDCNGAGTLRRYVYGADEAPVLWYEGAGLANKRYLHTDERGSVIALTDAGGALVRINAYDEYGIPQAWNLGRFQYTGQAWLPTLQMYSYKARIYSPTLGRFLQTDPIGYGDGMNWYNYVGGDPVNFTDPLGLEGSQSDGPDIIVKGQICAHGECRSYSGVAFGRNGQIVTVRTDTGEIISVDRNTIQSAVKQPRGKTQDKKLPPCAQKFLAGRISGDPGAITLHNGGSILNYTGNSVTYGSDIYLAGDRFGRTDPGAMWNKFHEIAHTSQNARMDLSGFDHAMAYLMFGGHDASPLEKAADDFATATRDAYMKAGLDKTCPF